MCNSLPKPSFKWRNIIVQPEVIKTENLLYTVAFVHVWYLKLEIRLIILSYTIIVILLLYFQMSPECDVFNTSQISKGISDISIVPTSNTSAI
jgi:hypothetical protein